MELLGSIEWAFCFIICLSRKLFVEFWHFGVYQIVCTSGYTMAYVGSYTNLIISEALIESSQYCILEIAPSPQPCYKKNFMNSTLQRTSNPRQIRNAPGLNHISNGWYIMRLIRQINDNPDYSSNVYIGE